MSLPQTRALIMAEEWRWFRLLADGKWAATTPFTEVLGPLNGKIDVLSLRTNKADPM